MICGYRHTASLCLTIIIGLLAIIGVGGVEGQETTYAFSGQTFRLKTTSEGEVLVRIQSDYKTAEIITGDKRGQLINLHDRIQTGTDFLDFTLDSLEIAETRSISFGSILIANAATALPLKLLENLLGDAVKLQADWVATLMRVTQATGQHYSDWVTLGLTRRV